MQEASVIGRVDGPTIEGQIIGKMDFTNIKSTKSTANKKGQLQGSPAAVSPMPGLGAPGADLPRPPPVHPVSRGRVPRTSATTVAVNQSDEPYLDWTEEVAPAGPPLRKYTSEPADDTNKLFTADWTITSKTVINDMWPHYTAEQNVAFFSTHHRDYFDLVQNLWLIDGWHDLKRLGSEGIPTPAELFYDWGLDRECASKEDAIKSKRKPRNMAISEEELADDIRAFNLIIERLSEDLRRANAADKFFAAAKDDKMIMNHKTVATFISS